MKRWAAYPSQVFAADFHRRRVLGKPYESSNSPELNVSTSCQSQIDSSKDAAGEIIWPRYRNSIAVLSPMPNFGTVPTFYLTIRDVEVLRFSDFESPKVKLL